MKIIDGVFDICCTFPDEVGKQIAKVPEGVVIDIEAIRKLAAREVAQNIIKYIQKEKK